MVADVVAAVVVVVVMSVVIIISVSVCVDCIGSSGGDRVMRSDNIRIFSPKLESVKFC